MRNLYIRFGRGQQTYQGDKLLLKLSSKVDHESIWVKDDAAEGDEIYTEMHRFTNEKEDKFLIERLNIVKIERCEETKEIKDIITSESLSTIRIDKISGKIENLDILENYYKSLLDGYNKENYIIILDYLVTYIKHASSYLYDELIEKDAFNTGCLPHLETVIINVFKMCNNLSGAEKLLKATKTRAARNMIRSKSFELNNAKKLSNVINLPTFALEHISKSNMASLQQPFTRIVDLTDGNNLKILIEYLQSIRRFGPRKGKEAIYAAFTTSIADLLELGYRISPLLKYITKQQLLIKRELNLPTDPAMYLKDYFNMASEMNVKFEKYPQNIERSHYIIMKNYSLSMSGEIKEKFKEAISEKLHLEVKGTDYSLIMPRTVEEMIAEGNDLHHCVASYCKKVVLKETNVLFFRKTDALDTSFVTVELDDNHNILQAKILWNEDASPEILNEIKKLVNTL